MDDRYLLKCPFWSLLWSGFTILLILILDHFCTPSDYPCIFLTLLTSLYGSWISYMESWLDSPILWCFYKYMDWDKLFLDCKWAVLALWDYPGLFYYSLVMIRVKFNRRFAWSTSLGIFKMHIVRCNYPVKSSIFAFN